MVSLVKKWRLVVEFSSSYEVEVFLEVHCHTLVYRSVLALNRKLTWFLSEVLKFQKTIEVKKEKCMSVKSFEYLNTFAGVRWFECNRVLFS